MALYKYAQYLVKADMGEFDNIYHPGDKISWSGIYQCQGCGKEIVHTTAHPLPPQNHHQHTSTQGSIRWRLVVTDRA